METNNPSTPTGNYDWSSHVNNDPPPADNTMRGEDPDSEQDPEEPKVPTFEEIDRKCLNAIEEIYGTRNPTRSIFEPEVINKFRDFIGQEMPQEIVEIFQNSGYTEPYEIINLFGGNQQTLVRFICYNRPSIFLVNKIPIFSNDF